LRLLQRQFKINNFGKIDLLCEDKNNNLVIVEIKIYASTSAINQIKIYKKAILFKFPEKKARFILVYLRKNKDIPNLCKTNNIEFLQIRDKRIPKYEDFSDFSFKEKEIVDHILSNTNLSKVDPLYLSYGYDLTMKEIEIIIDKINKKTGFFEIPKKHKYSTPEPYLKEQNPQFPQKSNTLYKI